MSTESWSEPKRPEWFEEALRIHKVATKHLTARHEVWRFLSIALAEEAGEVCGVVKKHWRGSMTFEEMLPKIREEMADVRIYLEALAWRLNTDLDKEVQKKLEEVKTREFANRE